MELSDVYAIKRNDKRTLLLADIKEIYENRIEYSELTDYPYSKKTPLADVERYAKIFFSQQYYRLTGKRLTSLDDVPFVMYRARDEQNNFHIYCTFHLKKWDRMIEEANEEK